MPRTFPHSIPSDRRWQFSIGRQVVRIAERDGLLRGWSTVLAQEWPEVFFLGASAHHIITQWAPFRGWRCTPLSPENALSHTSNARRHPPVINNNCVQGVDKSSQICDNADNRGVDQMPVQPASQGFAPALHAPQRLDYTLSRYLEVHHRSEGIMGALSSQDRDTISKLLLADMVVVFGHSRIAELLMSLASRVRSATLPPVKGVQQTTPPSGAAPGDGVASLSPTRGNAVPLTHTQRILQGV